MGGRCTEMRTEKEVKIFSDKQLADLAKQASKTKVPHSHEGLTIETSEVAVYGDKVVTTPVR